MFSVISFPANFFFFSGQLKKGRVLTYTLISCLGDPFLFFWFLACRFLFSEKGAFFFQTARRAVL